MPAYNCTVAPNTIAVEDTLNPDTMSQGVPELVAVSIIKHSPELVAAPLMTPELIAATAVAATAEKVAPDVEAIQIAPTPPELMEAVVAPCASWNTKRARPKPVALILVPRGTPVAQLLTATAGRVTDKSSCLRVISSPLYLPLTE